MPVSRDVILSRIGSVIRELFPTSPPELLETVRIQEDLGADSLHVVSLIIALDSEFDIEFEPAMLPSHGVTIGWITDFVAAKLNS